MSRKPTPSALAAIQPVRPSAAIAEAYAKRLTRLVDRMARDVEAQLAREYRRNPPVAATLYAQDASPSVVLGKAMAALGRKWLKQFDRLADDLSSYFATETKDRVDRSLRADLRRGGFTVRFKMTAAMNDAFQAVRAENARLITSVPERYLAQVETLVQQSVAAGRDIATLAQGLQKQAGVTRRRAAFIARDQNNRATAVMTRARQLEMGITRAKWLHSAGGHEPRKEHVAFSGKTYDVAKGHDFDNGEGIVWPGTAINCRCVSIPVIPGFDDE